jgi:hypothetical protein
MSAMGTCRGCGAEVIWCKTAKGKSMPLDAVPFSEGNIRIVDGVANYGDKGTGPYVSHFATCPKAGDWRKR